MCSSSAVGHLLQLSNPAEVARGKWSFAHLPMIPPHFDVAPIDKRGEDRLKLLARLIKRKDVTELINACDAGREGELIFRYIVQHARAKHPVRRLWLQSMTPAAIREAFGRTAVGCGDAPSGGRRALPRRGRLAGRHQRHAGDDRLQQQGRRLLQDHGGPRADADAGDRGRARGEDPAVRAARLLGGARDLRLPGPASTRAAGSIPISAARRTTSTPAPNGCGSRQKAEAIVEACRGRTGTVSEEAKPSTQAPPLLFDLTSLQREGNGRFGFSAKTTLSIAQALYEKHKVLTYPRTDSRALPEDYVAVAKKTVDARRPALLRAVREADRQERLDQAQQADLRQQPRSPTTSPSSRPWRRRAASARPSRRSTTWWSSASWRSSSRRPSTW
jgi:DNA topoisomerase III